MSDDYYLPPFIKSDIKKITKHFNGKYCDCIEVIINGKDYQICQKASEYRWCNNKEGHYGKGLANTFLDQCKVSRIGLLGEAAFAKIFQMPFNVAYKKG